MSIVLACAIALAGCALTTTTASLPVHVEVIDAMKRYERVYLLQPGDQVEIFVYRHPDFSRKAIIRPDGFLSLPLLGEVAAAGKAPSALAAELTGRFGARLKNPEVSVIVENPLEPMVYVVGDVAAPRAVPLRQVRTVAQAIAQAGNAVRSASLSSVSVIRLNASGMLEAHSVDSDGFSQPEIYMALQAMPVQANDLIVVPESYRGQMVRAIQDLNAMIAPFFQFWLTREVLD